MCNSKIKSWVVPAKEMALVSELQKESMESFGYLAPATAAGRSADDSSKPATPGLARGKVLEVKGGGIYGYIRPEDRSGDLETAKQ